MELLRLDTMPAAGVHVGQITLTASYPYDKMWAVTFIDNGVGGNVANMMVDTSFNTVTGTNVAVLIYADGKESIEDLRGADAASGKGNELSGTFYCEFPRAHHRCH